MKPTPRDWPRISSSLFYDDAPAAIDWLCKAFGFEVRLKVEGEGGRIEHSELIFGEGLIMVSSTGREKHPGTASYKSPRSLGGANTQTVFVYVDDADAHCARAKAAGAKIMMEPETHDYGEDYWADRTYGCLDPEEHQWWFAHRISTGKSGQ
jgi:uncharacterized glyoxalase superfamily protein PhnB